MGRLFNFALLGLVIAAATWTYQIKHVADERLTEIRQMERQIALEKETIDLLEADWAHLSNPARLQALIDRYKEELKLEVTSTDQLIGVDELPGKAPEQSSDAVADILAGEVDPGTTASVGGN